MKYLSTSLSTLKHLVKLDLSGNFITSDGVEFLSSIFINDFTALSELIELNVNCNPLCDESIKFLSKFCCNLPKLKSLWLSDCQITFLGEYNLNFENLLSLDLSLNHLNHKCIHRVLSRLNSCQIEVLNIGYTIQEKGTIQKELTTFFDSGTVAGLKLLDLSECFLNDSDIYDLLRSIAKSTHLETLILTNNYDLTSISFKCILSNLTTQLKELRLDGCEQILLNHDLDNYLLTLTNLVLPEIIVLTITDDTLLNSIRDIWLKFCENNQSRIIVKGNYVKLFYSK